jgi:N-methylhydantoinase A
VLFELDMHYVGQTHTVAVPLPAALAEGGVAITEAIVAEAFETAYQSAFSRLLHGIPARIVNLRVSAIGRRPAFDLKALAPVGGSMEAARLGERKVWFDGGWTKAAIWDRLALPVGAVVQGPVILEQPDATTVLDPGLAARVDGFGNLIVERG